MMNSVSLNVEQFGTQYYKISCLMQEVYGEWQGEAVVKRKDTGEEVHLDIVWFDKRRDKVEQNIIKDLAAQKSFLLTPPPDWESKVRSVLVFLRKLDNFIISHSLMMEDGNNQSNFLFSFTKRITSDTLELVRKIDALSKQERLDLLTVSDDFFTTNNSPYQIEDESPLRGGVFKYFLHPTAEEKKIYELNWDKIVDYGKKLDC